MSEIRARRPENGSRKLVSGAGPAMEDARPEAIKPFHRIPGGTLGPNILIDIYIYIKKNIYTRN